MSVELFIESPIGQRIDSSRYIFLPNTIIRFGGRVYSVKPLPVPGIVVNIVARNTIGQQVFRATPMTGLGGGYHADYTASEPGDYTVLAETVLFGNMALGFRVQSEVADVNKSKFELAVDPPTTLLGGLVRVSATVTDPLGRYITGAPIIFTITYPTGLVYEEVFLTTSEGIAWFNAGCTQVGEYTVVARLSATSPGLFIKFDVVAKQEGQTPPDPTPNPIAPSPTPTPTPIDIGTILPVIMVVMMSSVIIPMLGEV